MTSPNPTEASGGTEKPESVPWTSIKLNVIMIPVSIAVLVLLMSILCFCRYLRNKRNKELEKQRHKEIRAAKKNYNEKLQSGIRNEKKVVAQCNGKGKNGKPYSPRLKRCNEQGSLSSSSSHAVIENGHAINIVHGSGESQEGRHGKGTSMKREGTFTIDDENGSLSVNDDVEVEDNECSSPKGQPVRKNTFTLDNDNENNDLSEDGLDRSEGDTRLHSIEIVKPITASPSSPVKVTLRNGTVGLREELPHPSLDSPMKDAPIWDKPPPAYLTTKLLKNERKLTPITLLPITK